MRQFRVQKKDGRVWDLLILELFFC
jgi:hypothetical protein